MPGKLSRILVLLSLALVSLACGMKPAGKSATVSSSTPNEQQVAPSVQLTINPTLKLAVPLEFRWRISNSGTQPIYIYSSLGLAGDRSRFVKDDDRGHNSRQHKTSHGGDSRSHVCSSNFGYRQRTQTYLGAAGITNRWTRAAGACFST